MRETWATYHLASPFPPTLHSPSMLPPSDPIAAVTHPDPYPFYAALAAERPIYHDATLGLWIVSGDEAVAQVLASDACRVRPVDEPVPASLIGSDAGELFGQLVRMTDGAGHCPLKRVVVTALDGVDDAPATSIVIECARRLADALGSSPDRHAVGTFAFRLSVHVVGTLLGVPVPSLDETAALVDHLVRGLAPGAASDRVVRAAHAASRLCEIVGARCDAADDTLAGTMARVAQQYGVTPDAVVANAVGFLSQSYEATAGLIGNTLLALATRATPHPVDVAAARSLVEMVARRDPAVHNTRRFVARDVAIAGQTLRAGDRVLVVLAAARRGFGAGAHRCPGERLAVTIASAGVAELITRGVSLDPAHYRASPNVRVPFPAD